MTPELHLYFHSCRRKGRIRWTSSIGDEIEAVFDAPLPLEDHPQRATRGTLPGHTPAFNVPQPGRAGLSGFYRLEHGVGASTPARWWPPT
ncbi:hypothetical protein DFAR_1110073 [Desulfarculales bacterium]